MKISENKKKKGVYCCAYGCHNVPNPKKAGLCDKHYYWRRRKLDPVGVRFTQAKNKAKARGLEWLITIEEFRAFCERTGYLHVRGYRGRNATIDRRCNVHGYFIWNIQILTNRANASKGDRPSGEDFDCPF